MPGAGFRFSKAIAANRVRACRPGIAAALLLLSAAAHAQAPMQAPAAGTGADAKLPVQIQADSGIEWDQNAHLYVARGNAVATRGPSEVHADVLIAHYREA